MNNKIDELIKKYENERDKINNELDTISVLKDLFPDLSYDINRWDRVRYYAPSITKRANKVNIHHSCGCCDDAALIARPYIDVNVMGETITVYNNANGYYIGDKACSGGYYPNIGWGTKLKNENIPYSVIEQIEKYFIEHCDEYTEEDTWID